MRDPNIILTGFMGTGKSTVGRLIAEKLGYAFVDSDERIEERNQMGIPEIFDTLGEPTFRRMETEVSLDLAEQEKLVIATGGKLMLDPVNADALSQSGFVFCLTAEPKTIMTRVLSDTGTKRPLLETPDPEKSVLVLLAERKEGYGRFPQIDTTEMTPEMIADTIIGEFKKQRQSN